MKPATTRDPTWDYWTAIMENPEAPPKVSEGDIHSGYYRTSSFDRVVIWRDGAHWYCEVNDRALDDEDAIADLFVTVCRLPVDAELFRHVKGGGKWPHELTPTIGHNSAGTPFEMKQGEIEGWLELLREEEAKGPLKAGETERATRIHDIGTKLAELFSESDKMRLAETKPHRDAEAAVNKLWSPILLKAKEGRDKAKKVAGVYKTMMEQKAAAAIQAAREAAERAAAEAGIEAAAITVATAPTRIGTRKALSTRTTLVIDRDKTDWKAVANWYLSMTTVPPDLIDVLGMLVNRNRKAGGDQPPGVIMKEKVDYV